LKIIKREVGLCRNRQNSVDRCRLLEKDYEFHSNFKAFEDVERRSPLTTKEQILELVKRLNDDATIDQAIYKLELLKNIQLGLDQIEKGQVFDHDEVFEELLRDDEESKDTVVKTGKRKSQRNKKVHQSKRPKDGHGIHKTEYVRRLEFFPESGESVQEYQRPDVREIVFGNYRIIYRFDGRQITIITVYHGARLLDDRFLESE
jgi:ABC-type methionine transport system ATPase subunit